MNNSGPVQFKLIRADGGEQIFLGKPSDEVIKGHIGGIVTVRRTDRGALVVSHPWRVGGNRVIIYGEDFA
jgi:hypothetical protein